MRLNIYAEEWPDDTDVEVVSKTADTGITFYGARFYLKSAPELHDRPDDDDRSAVTIWVPWTRQDGHDGKRVAEALRTLADQVDQRVPGPAEHDADVAPGEPRVLRPRDWGEGNALTDRAEAPHPAPRQLPGLASAPPRDLPLGKDPSDE